MAQLIDTLLDFLFPTKCLFCETDLIGTQGICESCRSSIKFISSPFCLRCGVPFNSKIGRDHICGTCLTSKKYFTKARAVGFYEGILQKAIHRFKYSKKTVLANPLSAFIIDYNLDSMDLESYDFLVPVPLHFKRLKERGFNQALSLARHISKRSGIPVDYLNLRRIRWEAPQINLSKKERAQNVKGAFSLHKKNGFKDKNILLIDDVYTSGATVNECARVLLKAGTAGVDVVTLCRAV